jgi:hypothetical protein
MHDRLTSHAVASCKVRYEWISAGPLSGGRGIRSDVAVPPAPEPTRALQRVFGFSKNGRMVAVDVSSM